MSSAMNHRKRSHRSQQGHYAASRNRIYTAARKSVNDMDRLLFPRFFKRKSLKKQNKAEA